MIRRHVSIILACLLLSAEGSAMGLLKFNTQSVPYNTLGSYMEYSIEEDTIVIKAICSISSTRFINDFKIEKECKEKHERYYLTFYLNRKLDEQPNPNIELTAWGIKLKLRNEGLKDEGQFYYRDDTGDYKIYKGNRETWRNYVTKTVLELYKSKLNSEQINKIL